MRLQIPIGNAGNASTLVTAVLELIAQGGGHHGEWYCDTTADEDETRASHQVLVDAEFISVQLQTADQATELKACLATYGLICAPDVMTRGGNTLYCFRVRDWNAHTVRHMPADYYRPPPWLGLLR